ncbi:MAG: hypothetical protein AB9882_11975 [Ignavibacteriaceae bacterium]
MSNIELKKRVNWFLKTYGQQAVVNLLVELLAENLYLDLDGLFAELHRVHSELSQKNSPPQ